MPGTGETTYDPAHNYQIDKVYLPTKTRRLGQGHRRAQADYGYDARHRLTSITHQLCRRRRHHTCSDVDGNRLDTYTYDDNDNRTQVARRNGGGERPTTTATTRSNRLPYRQDAPTCTSSPTETYTYDAAGQPDQDRRAG